MRAVLCVVVACAVCVVACVSGGAPTAAPSATRANAMMMMGDSGAAVGGRRALRSIGSHAGASTPVHRKHLSTGISKELVDRVAKDGSVIVTWANSHYYDFAINWVMHLEAAGATNYLVGAMDEDMYTRLRKVGVNTWLMGSQGIDSAAVKKDFGWGSKNFHKMGRDKIRLIHDFTKTGVDVLISDIDVTWLRNPIPFFRRYPQADILVSTDNLKNDTHAREEQAQHRFGDEGLEYNACGGTANIGMMWFRSTEGSQEITREWVDNLEKDDKLWDQAEFNNLMKRGGCSESDGSGVWSMYDGKIKLGVLPVALFNNGHTYFAQRLPELLELNPYAMHATFQYEGTPGKRNRMRESNQWLGDRDVPEYFDVKFMSYTPRVLKDVDVKEFEKLGHPHPENTPSLQEGDEIIREHMRMVQHQAAQLYEAAAIAKKLGRVLILPPFFCGLDRAWFPHRGRFPGSLMRLPFICPADHVLAMESYGADFMKEYREFSFLGNAHLPEDSVVPENVRRVSVAPSVSFSKTVEIPEEYAMCYEKRDKDGKIIDSNGDACVPARNSVFRKASSVKLAKPAETLDELVQDLSTADNVKFLHFDTVIGVTTSSQSKTTKQIRLGIWCCRIGNHEFYKLDNVTLFESGTVDADAFGSTNETRLALPAAEDALSESTSTITVRNITITDVTIEEMNKSTNETIVMESQPTRVESTPTNEAEREGEREMMMSASEKLAAAGMTEKHARSIEAGLAKFFAGDLDKIKAASDLIAAAHAEIEEP